MTERMIPVSESLIDVATGKIAHRFNGECPDGVEGWDVRDDECDACKIIVAAEHALLSQPTPTAAVEHGPTVDDIASRHCETSTSASTCADNPSRSADSPYGATGYCYPCLIRNALSLSIAEPCCARPGDPRWHTADGSHVVPPDIEEDTPVASPPDIADMAPGTTFTAELAYGDFPHEWKIGDDGVPRIHIWTPVPRPDRIDPSTIRDVTPPPTTPEGTPA